MKNEFTKKIDLNSRLQLIANIVPNCKCLADIGTDHAWIPIVAVLEKKCSIAIASDVVEGPLKIAKKNLSNYSLENKIELRLGSGLNTLNQGEADCIVIAGMGGFLIHELLEERKNILEGVQLILQPMNNIELLREYLFKNGFDIINEELVYDSEKLYVIIVAKWDGHEREVNDIDCYLNPKILIKHVYFKDYLNKQYKRVTKMLKGLKESKTPNNQEIVRFIRLIEEMQLIKDV